MPFHTKPLSLLYEKMKRCDDVKNKENSINYEIDESIYEEVLIESNNTPIALSIWKSRKEDPCVVFLPGTMTHPLFYLEFLSILAKEGFNVIGVHPVSHGKSPREKIKYDFNDMIQNAKDAITYAIERFNDNVLLMGSSQGGILTIALAGLDHRIKAAFPHNILVPQLSDSISVTNFPKWFRNFYGLIIGSMKLGAKIAPGMKIPISFYLDDNKIFGEEETKKRFYQDPIGITSYPLYFLASLFSADMKQICDGSIKCPVIVIASKGDTLFPFDYCQKVFDMIVAPKKEMLIFEENRHLIMNECVNSVAPAIVKKLQEYS